MTEYWVSQGNKWCDFCKIYIANNPASIRTHEFGQRHKDNVAKRLADIRKENVTKEKEKQQALKDMERIEAQARRSYQKDLAAQERIAGSAAATTATVASNTPSLLRSGSLDASSNEDWVHDGPSGYSYSSAAGCYYDSKSGLYYSEKLGKWTSQQEALKESAVSACMPEKKVELLVIDTKTGFSTKPPGVGLKDLKSTMPLKGKASSLEVGKRKRQEKPQPLSKDEVNALKAREAAKKRVQEREKGLLGLYQSY